MGFGIGFALSRSGLDGAAKAIDAIGHNIANAQTAGYKTLKVRFQDVSVSGIGMGGSNKTGGAAGVTTPSVATEFDQGNMMPTGNSLDVGIVGPGFLRFQKGADVAFSRNGQLAVSEDGTSLIASADSRNELLRNNTSNIHYLTGRNAAYATDPLGDVDAVGNLVGADKAERIVWQATMAGSATSTVDANVTLDAGEIVPAEAFDPGNSATYNHVATTKVFDSASNPQSLALYMVRTANPNAWKVYAAVVNPPGAESGDPRLTAPAFDPNPLDLTFDTSGRLTTSAPLGFAAIPLANGDSVGPISVDFAGSVQYGSAKFSITNIAQRDGWEAGELSQENISIGANGMVYGRYSNGMTRKLGQIMLSEFTNRDALVNVGDGMWSAVPGEADGTGKEISFFPIASAASNRKEWTLLSTLKSGVVESSNVDLATQLVGLIEQQRNYQASAQTFKALDEALRNLAQIR